MTPAGTENELTFIQIVLHWRSREDDPTRGLQGVHQFEGLRLRVLQGVAFITDKDVRTRIDEAAMDDVQVSATQRLVHRHCKEKKGTQWITRLQSRTVNPTPHVVRKQSSRSPPSHNC